MQDGTWFAVRSLNDTGEEREIWHSRFPLAQASTSLTDQDLFSLTGYRHPRQLGYKKIGIEMKKSWFYKNYAKVIYKGRIIIVPCDWLKKWRRNLKFLKDLFRLDQKFCASRLEAFLPPSFSWQRNATCSLDWGSSARERGGIYAVVNVTFLGARWFTSNIVKSASSRFIIARATNCSHSLHSPVRGISRGEGYSPFSRD